MTTSPSSGLSPEAKEFVPIGQTPSTSIPLYVDENTVASIYPSDQQPLMVQAIYPMMITNSKLPDNLSFPEIEFHIQPSQQQQFHIDSCANISQTSSSNSNSNSSNTNTSQIVLLPTTNSVAAAVTPTGYYPGAQILYPTNESLAGFYPMDYCEPLINFSLQHPSHFNKSNRISSQQRPNSFRQQQQHGIYRPSSRGTNRGTGNHTNHRNPYYEYNNSRRNGSAYNRGNSSTSKRISSSHHSHEYNNNNNYYHHSSSRSRGNYSTHPYDEYRKNHSDYYHEDNDYHYQSSHINDDETPFEFRPEDFPSLPINNPSSDKSPSQSTLSTNTKATSSWNEIVSSAPRPHSTSPHAVASNQDPRSDRSRSFNTKTTERKSSNHKKSNVPSAKSPSRASKIVNSIDHESSQSIPLEQSDDGFIQTKHQHRRLKRKNKLKEDFISYPQSILDENDTQVNLNPSPDDSNIDHLQLDDMLDALNNEQSKTHQTMKNPRMSKKRSEENQNNSSRLTVESQNGTEPDYIHSMDKQTPNSHPLSSNSDNSSDTSDYDDAVDNFDD